MRRLSRIYSFEIFCSLSLGRLANLTVVPVMKWAKRKLVKQASKMMNKWFDSKIANVNNSLLGLLTETNKTTAQSGDLGTYLSNVTRVTLGTLSA